MRVAHGLRKGGRFAAALLVSCALFGSVSSNVAEAQTKKELAQLREKFREGLALETGGNYARALEVFKIVAEMKSTPQVRMHIAQCEEKTGDYIRALGSYRLALVDAEAARVKEVIDIAQESIASLEPKIPSLKIDRGDGAQVASITLDGRVLGATEVGTSFPINPGPHVLEATTPGRKPMRVEMNLKDGEKKTIDVTLEAEGGSTDPTGSAAPTDAPTSTGGPDVPPSSMSPMRTAGFVIGGLGIAGMAVAGAFIGVRQSTLDDLESKCGADHQSCPPDAQDIISQGELQSNLVTGLFIGGGVTAALGLVLVLVAPSSAKTTAARLGITPVVTGAHKGAALSWKF